MLLSIYKVFVIRDKYIHDCLVGALADILDVVQAINMLGAICDVYGFVDTRTLGNNLKLLAVGDELLMISLDDSDSAFDDRTPNFLVFGDLSFVSLDKS